MAAIFEKFAKIWHMYFFNTLGVENFDEIALSLTVKEIEAILCFATFGKNSKIQNGRHFWKNFKTQLSLILKYLEGRKYRRNRSISNG